MPTPTAAQLTALRADILANAATIPAGQPWTNSFAGFAVSAIPNSGDGNATIAGWYSQTASPDYFVLRTEVPVADLFDQITWANFTPADAPDTSAAWTNRSLACQGKQFNLQTMLTGRTTFDATKIKQRAGLNDATTNVPSGAAGALQSGGWANILPILRRLARRVEKLFGVQTSGVGVVGTDALGGTTNPALMGFEGGVTGTDVENARNLP